MANAKPKNPVDLDRSAVSRYLQLASLFRRRIEYGDWPVGRQIPTLDELTAECGVAPATIRKALDGLVEEGLLARYRAKGTYVLRSPVQSIWWEIETDGAGFLRARSGPVMKLIHSKIVEAPPFKPHAQGELAPSYRMIRRVYWRDGRPFVLNDLYMDASRAGDIPRSALTTMTNQQLVDSAVDVAAIRQTITIGSADIEAAHFLDIPLNAPVARIDRSRLDHNGVLVSVSIGIYRGDVVRLDFVQNFPAP